MAVQSVVGKRCNEFADARGDVDRDRNRFDLKRPFHPSTHFMTAIQNVAPKNPVSATRTKKTNMEPTTKLAIIRAALIGDNESFFDGGRLGNSGRRLMILF
jgi:hypothetical protein